MKITRIENALRTNITNEDMKYIRIYYLKFYNNPEEYADSEMVRLILSDIGKQANPNWVNKPDEECAVFMYVSSYNKDLIPFFGKYEEFVRSHERETDRLQFSVMLVVPMYLSAMGITSFTDVDADLMLSVVRDVATKDSWDCIGQGNMNGLKRAWVSMARDYEELGLSRVEDVLYGAGRELARHILDVDPVPGEIISRMALAYDYFGKCLNMTMRCAKGLFINEDIVVEYVRRHISEGSIEVENLTSELCSSCKYSLERGEPVDKLELICREVFFRHVNEANIGHRTALISGEAANHQSACDCAIGKALTLAHAMQEAETQYIEDIQTALNQMKNHMDLLRSWESWDEAPWMERTAFGYCERIHGTVDRDVCWNYAIQRWTGWQMFASYVYGMNCAIRYHIGHRTSYSYRDAMEICERLYDDLKRDGESWLAKAKHKEGGGLSALLTLAGGK